MRAKAFSCWCGGYLGLFAAPLGRRLGTRGANGLTAPGHECHRRADRTDAEHQPAKAEDNVVKVELCSSNFPPLTRVAGGIVQLLVREKRCSDANLGSNLGHGLLIAFDLESGGEIVATAQHDQRDACHEKIASV